MISDQTTLIRVIRAIRGKIFAKIECSMPTEKRLIEAARELAGEADKLRFGPPVTHVYNPLAYAWKAHEQYLRRFGGAGKEVVFLGMNPGPFGMAQTGVPFGEIAAVRDWMKIDAPIGTPGEGTSAPARPRPGLRAFGSERAAVVGPFCGTLRSAGKVFRGSFRCQLLPAGVYGGRERKEPDAGQAGHRRSGGTVSI